tara:strand:+ start:2838 stop:3278 length:441 start_codon:yes stop_codon:yes gene_type:complete
MIGNLKNFQKCFLVASIFSILFSVCNAETLKHKFSLQLNSAQTIENACRLTFVVDNQTEKDISELVFETVLFSQQGEVIFFTLFDFGEVPFGIPRVRQFDVPNYSCEDVKQVLINGMDKCVFSNGGAAECNLKLETSSRSKIGFLG